MDHLQLAASDPIPLPLTPLPVGYRGITKLIHLSYLDKRDVHLCESVAEEKRPQVVLLQQELQHVQAGLLVVPGHTRPCFTKRVVTVKGQ